jgi:integrase
VLIRLHRVMRWNYPRGLWPDLEADDGPQDITLWDKDRPESSAVQIFFADPVIRQKPESTLARYSSSVLHSTRLFTPDTRMANIWVSELRAYYATRLSEKAAPATIGGEITTLSGIVEVLIARRRTTGKSENPCRHTRGAARGTGLSFKGEARHAYLSDSFIHGRLIAAYNTLAKRTVDPYWLKNLILTSYHSGMRMEEILNLRRHQVFLGKLMIFLAAANTKEGRSKRIPLKH